MKKLSPLGLIGLLLVVILTLPTSTGSWIKGTRYIFLPKIGTGRSAWAPATLFETTHNAREEALILDAPAEVVYRRLRKSIAKDIERLTREVRQLRMEVESLKLQNRARRVPGAISSPVARTQWKSSEFQLALDQLGRTVVWHDASGSSYTVRHASLAPHRPREARTNNPEYQDAVNYYEANKTELLREYLDQYVAIINASVVDHDSDYSALAERVFKKYGPKSIFMPRVQKREQVVRVRPGHEISRA